MRIKFISAVLLATLHSAIPAQAQENSALENITMASLMQSHLAIKMAQGICIQSIQRERWNHTNECVVYEEMLSLQSIALKKYQQTTLGFTLLPECQQ